MDTIIYLVADWILIICYGITTLWLSMNGHEYIMNDNDVMNVHYGIIPRSHSLWKRIYDDLVYGYFMERCHSHSGNGYEYMMVW